MKNEIKLSWKLKRLGTQSTPEYELQPDIPIITAGRSRDCLLQFKGQASLRISRFHLEFHRSRQSSSRYKQLWQIRDPGSASGVFLNGGRIPPKKLIRLCDNDIIGVGGNFTEEDIKKSLSKSYLFRVVAPEIGVKKSQKRHACHYGNCNFSANAKYGLFYHMLKLHQSCLDCNVQLKKTALVDHMERVHNVKVKCELCPFQSFYRGQLNRHSRQKHGGQEHQHKYDKYLSLTQDNVYKCKFSHCNYRSLKNRYQALIHIVKNHQTCPECEDNLKNDDEAFEHMTNVHKWKVSCDFCQHKNFNIYVVRQHVRKKHSQELKNVPENQKNYHHHRCEFSKCSFASKNKQDWQVHMIGNHKKCPECKARLRSSEEEPLDHMANVHNWTVNRCEFCSYKTLRTHNLNDHIKRQHIITKKAEVPNVPIFLRLLSKATKWQTCEHCSYRTIYKHSLIYHMNLRHSDKKRKRIEDLYNNNGDAVCHAKITRKLIVLVIRRSELDSLAKMSI